MAWLQISLVSDPDNLYRIEEALTEAGALAITLMNPDDKPLLIEGSRRLNPGNGPFPIEEFSPLSHRNAPMLIEGSPPLLKRGEGGIKSEDQWRRHICHGFISNRLLPAIHGCASKEN